jgi:hypothetical protein
MSFISYFGISLVLEIAQVLYRDAQLLFAQVRPVKHLDFLVLQSFWRDIKLSELVVGMLLYVFLDRQNDVLFQVLDECLDERSANLINATFEPHIIVQEITLAS